MLRRKPNLSEHAQLKQAECYGFIAGFLMPPRPMTGEEWGEWFKTERLPIMQASGLTAQEASDALYKVLVPTS